ncbi:cytochrome b/b6 domain-containing protein [Mangrovicoccus algicola]|uniref:Cytochrome b/b6 domain-containing protein n=1 Tax=Mangrovicoccus algicola TaxID=2771008 RepID=A0A8J7CYT7_9RHOB|nr:cytochrome b/b6 domain-containing protein [Mangrovicoccus algicola]MBE3636943.1 cytochrome b/b6 domain-containing protein [Mangrovicoccus algicola]
MPASPPRNTRHSYGSVAKTFHWLTALLILSLWPLGYVAHAWPYDSAAALATKATLFSLHKTLGVTLFFVALARILWALGQPRPALLHPERRLESLAAETVHWVLYGALVAVPLAGWIDHAATEGFAPIWWPFGQSLPLVPKSPAVSALFGSLHSVFAWLLLGAVGLHVAGALKHHLIDRDATLRRMLPGRVAVAAPQAAHRHLPAAAAALAVWAVAVAVGLNGARPVPGGSPAAPALEQAASDWTVEDGSLEITVHQFGSDVTGRFADWTAVISFDPEAGPGPAGDAVIRISVPSLTLGTVTEQARGAEFFDASGFPEAVFEAGLERLEDGSYLARGTLELKGRQVPVELPFTLAMQDGAARATGSVTLDRRDFGIGTANHPDEGSLGFAVRVDIALTARPAGS